MGGRVTADQDPTLLNQIYAAVQEQELLVDDFLATPGPTQPFMQKLYEVLDLPPDEYLRFVKRQQARYSASLAERERDQLRTGTIPPITHRIWLTSPTLPHQPPPDYLAHYIQSLARLPSAVRHYFWTNSPEVAAAVGDKAAAAGCRDLAVMNIASFDGPIMQRVALLLDARKFVLAADVVKFIVLERYGGIYGDLGVFYDDHIFDLARMADYAFLVTHSRFFQTSFVACAAHATVARIFLGIMHRPGSFDPAYAMPDHEPTPIIELNMFAGIGLTACAMLFMPDEARAFMVPAQSPHLQCDSQRSWYGEKPKYGNTLIQASATTLITRHDFEEADKLFRRHVLIFGRWRLLAAQLRVLVPLHDYFSGGQNEPSDSDDSRCSYVCRLVLGRLLGDVSRILHLNGLSSRDTQANATEDGASLPVSWRALFPLATLVSLRQASAAVEETEGAGRPQSFDLIIDDGERGFALNRTLADAFCSGAVLGRALVVENVSDRDLQAWDSYLARESFSGAIVAMSGITGQRRDNFVLLGFVAQGGSLDASL